MVLYLRHARRAGDTARRTIRDSHIGSAHELLHLWALASGAFDICYFIFLHHQYLKNMVTTVTTEFMYGHDTSLLLYMAAGNPEKLPFRSQLRCLSLPVRCTQTGTQTGAKNAHICKSMTAMKQNQSPSIPPCQGGCLASWMVSYLTAVLGNFPLQVSSICF